MKKSVTVSVDSEKLSALEMYLGQKNMKLSEELEKFAEQLYQKYVPSNVREFIELTASKKPSRRTKPTAPVESENQSEQSFAAVRTVCHRVARFGGRWDKFTLNVVGANLGHLSQSLRMVEIR